MQDVILGWSESTCFPSCLKGDRDMSRCAELELFVALFLASSALLYFLFLLNRCKTRKLKGTDVEKVQDVGAA